MYRIDTIRGASQEHIGQKKSGYHFIFSAPSSRPLISPSDTTLESQEHGANSALSVASIRGLEKFHFLYGDTSERVILNILRRFYKKKIT